MNKAYIVDVIRTAGGRSGGRLSHYHAADLGGHVLKAFIKKNHVGDELIDDVILGCVSQVGAQSGNIARTIVLSADLDESVPATTVDRQCGSSYLAIRRYKKSLRATLLYLSPFTCTACDSFAIFYGLRGASTT